MPTHEPYAFWKASLAWRQDPKRNPMPDFDKHRPETGFYRGQRNEAVAIWWRLGRDGQPDQCMARVHRPARTGGGVQVQDYDRADQIGDSVFAYCCRQPISYEAYKAFTKDGLWPEDVVTMVPPQYKPGGLHGPVNGSVSPSSVHEGTAPEQTAPESSPPDDTPMTDRRSTPESWSPALEDGFETEIDALVQNAEGWLDSIGRKIGDKVHADKLANYSVVAQDIEDRAEAARKAEKEPLDNQIKAIQARWTPVIDRVRKIKGNLKTMLQPYLIEQRRKATQEAADAQRARDAAKQAGTLPPTASAPPSRSVAGTRGRVALKTRQVLVIDDLRAAAEFIAKLNNPPESFVEGVKDAAQLLRKAGVEVPGVSTRSEDVVA
jgi:hypothetical protein